MRKLKWVDFDECIYSISMRCKNKIAGEDAKFETGKLYEPFTFAQESLEEAVEKTPLSTRLRNIAERDFDVGQGAGMRMVEMELERLLYCGY